ncbi:MAG: hypothetical protein L3J37_04840 [Rhodobacteraceae bacterium]|nr:hypothetical protein [Paracoccaceae bacterium]
MKRQPLWRSTPPAIFPVILGLLGLANGLRWLAGIWGYPVAAGDFMLGISAALLLFFSLSYLAKLLARPGALLEDLRAPPGQAGLSALAVGFLVLAMGVLSKGEIARWFWWIGVGLFLLLLLFIINSRLKTPKAARGITPYLFLPFTGLSAAAMAGFSLGYGLLSQIFVYASLVAFIWLGIGLALKLARNRPPAPLRPAYAAFLLPPSLLGLGFGQFGPEVVFVVFLALAWLLALLMLVLAGWMTKSGFAPIWGEMVFPVAAFININIMAISKGYGTIANTGALAGVLIGTPLILFIAYKTLKMWTKRDLAKKTGAATA